MAKLSFPNNTQRMVIVGATGSGKTVAGMWQLSMRNYDEMPWYVVDFKYDSLINSIQNATHLDVKSKVPQRPGLYIVHPHPAEADYLEAQMWEVWNQENTGVFIDEGLMLGTRNNAFRALLTQGRSKHIPMIVLSQRPVWMDRFVFSESEYFQIFRLQHNKDLRAVNEFIPYDISKRLPEYHSYFYSVPDNRLVVLRPTPDDDAILSTFDAKLDKLKRAV